MDNEIQQQIGTDLGPNTTLSQYHYQHPMGITWFLSIYMFSLITIGSIGNTFVIYASTKYSTFNMDAITIFFVRHLAYADLSIIIANGLPIFITHLARRWVLGDILCKVLAYSFSFLPNATLCFTAIVGLHRLLRCTYPSKTRSFRKKHAKIVVYTVWLISAIPAVLKIVYKLDAVFLPPWATCYFDILVEGYPVLLNVVSKIIYTIPSIAILGSNVLLIIFSMVIQWRKRKQQSATSRQSRTSSSSNKTVYLISLLYVLSWIPFSISERYQKDPTLDMPIWVHNLLHHSYLLQDVGNPLIYCMVNRKFYIFAKKLLRKHCMCCQGLNLGQTVNSSNSSNTASNSALRHGQTPKPFIVLHNLANTDSPDTLTVSNLAVGDSPRQRNPPRTVSFKQPSLELKESELGPGGVYISNR